MPCFSPLLVFACAAWSPAKGTYDLDPDLAPAPASATAALLLGPQPPGSRAAPRAREDAGPWTLQQALGLPDWLSLSGTQRTRYESFDEQFRAGGTGSGQGVFMRTTLKAVARGDGFAATLEGIDSRQFDTPDDLPLNNGIVNALDVLQAHVSAEFTDVLDEGDALQLTLGRQTMDIGSRRLVARNRFRNTVNAFTGLRADWSNDAGAAVRAFYVLPVQRLPRGGDSLRDNDLEFDEERSQVRFFGVHARQADIAGPFALEGYAFGLDEKDGRDLATRNRELLTLGARLTKAPAAGDFDLDLEAVFQTGDSRASGSGADTTDLDHRAQFFHASTGYRWDAPGQPRLEFLFDYASGDDDPTDGDNERFDTLFGARRFEFGPTGIFGAFARSNLISPGLRFNVRLAENVQLMVANRFHYLASDRDAWTTAGLQDPTGASGDYIGNLREFRIRWDLHENVRLEFGAAHLTAGGFIDSAPGANPAGDSTYGYIATALTF